MIVADGTRLHFRIPIAKNHEDLKVQAKRILDEYSPGREWLIAYDSSAVVLLNGDGSSIIVGFESDVDARMMT